MTKFSPNMTLYGYHRGGTKSRVDTFKPEHFVDSDCVETAIENAHEFAAHWLAKWSEMPNPPRKFDVLLYLSVEFPDGREARKFKENFLSIRSSDKVLKFVDRNCSRTLRKYAELG